MVMPCASARRSRRAHRGFWNQPPGIYVQMAMEDLGIGRDDLEELRPEDVGRNIMIGDYPVLDHVFQRAHELREQNSAG